MLISLLCPINYHFYLEGDTLSVVPTIYITCNLPLFFMHSSTSQFSSRFIFHRQTGAVTEPEGDIRALCDITNGRFPVLCLTQRIFDK